ncbi:TonB-dependent receptor domain-containing protein [Roseiterribacter gracilis]|uniref:TonB-dependent receptor n=1 Tax=Roseiterribacter gracilis TaxID=2812848 RepID=A0A8S8XB57_9PROT|nr:TonB-dependent receptor [Rhodospirillales bacterium TMPK1]
MSGITTKQAAALAALLLATTQAQAQTAPPDVTEVVVTGSRIRNPDATSISPVSAVSGAELQARGAARVEDLLNTLPQVYADQGAGNRGGTVGASGTATINLRNLGNQRTLVLIDGRRLMQGDPARASAQAADLNNIPAALVQRIEVVTGGASAVYGSDAIAGVVNFIMKRNFEGIEVNADAGFASHTQGNNIRSVAGAAGQPYPSGTTFDGPQGAGSVTFGKNFADGRGNITGYVGYRQIEGIGTSERDFPTCNLAANATGYGCSLSSTTFPGQFQLTNPTTGAVRATLALNPATGNTFRTYTAALDGFNNGNTYDLQAPDKRINGALFGKYELAKSAELYGEFMYMHDRADIRISPTGVFTVPEQISCSNPFLSASQRDQICGSVGLTPAQNATVNVSYRNALGGSRHDYTTHDSYRAVGGVRGDLGGSWKYDVYGQYGFTDYSSRLTNEISLAKFAKGLNVVSNAAGQPVCAAALNGTDPSCVPFNIWQIGGTSAAALNYVTNTVRRTGYLEEAIGSGSVTGDLIKLSPLSEQKISVAAGAEYRHEKISFTPDIYYQTRDTAGNSGGEFPIAGSFDVKEVFGEARIPLITDRPFFNSLSAEVGGRYSDYSTAGTTESFKLGAEWSPVQGIRVRSGLQRAVRAPNLTELFGPQRTVTAALTDPCEGARPTASFAACQRSGVTAVQYGLIAPAAGQQSGALIGGNPNLSPETSRTKTFGVQFNPPQIPGLTLSLDYFDIDVQKLITTVPAGIELTQCINANTFCNLIQRNPATGSLVTGGFVTTTYVNAGYLKTKGIDVAATYAMDLGSYGAVALNFAGTHLSKYEVQILSGTPSYRCDGLFGVTCGIPLPTWRHRLTTTWTPADGPYSVSATWRFIGSTSNDKSSSAQFLTATYQPYDLKMAQRHYFDLSASAALNDNLTLRLAINNLLDKDPPLSASTGGQVANGAFYGGMYDSIGRYMSLGATYKF